MKELELKKKYLKYKLKYLNLKKKLSGGSKCRERSLY